MYKLGPKLRQNTFWICLYEEVKETKESIVLRRTLNRRVREDGLERIGRQ